MKKIHLEVLGLSTNPQHNEYTLVLSEVGGERKLPILIGGLEAQAIVMHLENQMSPRPSTHDLLYAVISDFNFLVNEIVIDGLDKGVFYAKIICEQNGVVRQIDARPSDAIALAVRANASIFVLEDILNVAGVSMTKKEEESNTPADVMSKESPQKKDSGSYTGDDDVYKLQLKLKEAIDVEDYERAAKLRDEIKRKTSH